MEKDTQVMLGHGSGGVMMKRIIDQIFVGTFASPELLEGNDAAILSLPKMAESQESVDAAGDSDGPSTQQADAGRRQCDFPSRIAFSTDTFVVTPHFFPGGDIGRLAVCGTVNDVSTSGAKPMAISCAMILEEGYPMEDLVRICESMRAAADEAGVSIVTGDTKVVNRGKGDGVFINTAGIGVVPAGLSLSGANCKPGDSVLVSGTLGDHGIAIMSCREGLNFQTPVKSDAAPLNHLVARVLEAAPNVRCFRDPTRGGLASTLNELAMQSNVDICVEETKIPVLDAVRGACEMLGYDVLQVANEGKMVCVVPSDEAEAALAAMKAGPYGEDAAIIGEVVEADSAERGPRVFLQTAFGSKRILDMLVGEQLPRIC